MLEISEMFCKSDQAGSVARMPLHDGVVVVNHSFHNMSTSNLQGKRMRFLMLVPYILLHEKKFECTEKICANGKSLWHAPVLKNLEPGFSP